MKVGMMWPVRAAGGNAVCVRVAVAVEAMACPVAVRIDVRGPMVFVLVSGAEGMK